jgi:predicted transcriptional regulator
MVAETVRTHVVLPKKLVSELDKLVGARRRSRFVEEAIAEKLARERQARAFEDTSGVLKGKDYPEWETPEKVSDWVRRMRAVDNAATERKLRRRDA